MERLENGDLDLPFVDRTQDRELAEQSLCGVQSRQFCLSLILGARGIGGDATRAARPTSRQNSD